MTRFDTDRLIFLLDTVRKEGEHLLQTARRLSEEPVDPEWAKRLEDDLELSERVDAFGARFGRLQDTIGDKLIPELLRCLSEPPGAALDNLNRMEKLELLDSVAEWLEARNLRNRLIHEYVRDPAEFADALRRAQELVPMLVRTYDSLNRYARDRFAAENGNWPLELGSE